MSRHLVQATLISVLILCGFSASVAEDVRDQVNHYTLTLPVGWGEMPAEMLQTINDDMVDRQVRNVVYHRGLQPRDHFLVQYPYILMQASSFGGATPSYEQIEKMLNAMRADAVKEYSGKMIAYLGELTVGQ